MERTECELLGSGYGREEGILLFSPLKLPEMRVAVTYNIHIFTLGTKEGFDPPVVEALADARRTRCKNLKDQAPCRTGLPPNWNWNTSSHSEGERYHESHAVSSQIMSVETIIKNLLILAPQFLISRHQNIDTIQLLVRRGYALVDHQVPRSRSHIFPTRFLKNRGQTNNEVQLLHSSSHGNVCWSLFSAEKSPGLIPDWQVTTSSPGSPPA